MKSSVTQDIEPQEVTIANTAFREQLDLIPLPSASRQSRLGDPQTNENLRRADHAVPTQPVVPLTPVVN